MKPCICKTSLSEYNIGEMISFSLFLYSYYTVLQKSILGISCLKYGEYCYII